MSAAPKFSALGASEGVKPDASGDFFDLIMSGEIAYVSQDQLAELEGVRDLVGETLEYGYPPRQEPRDVDRSSNEFFEMATWERGPLVAE